MTLTRNRLLAAALTSFALMAACGGGGQDANAPSNPASSASAAASSAPTETAPVASAAPSASAAPAASAAPTPSATAAAAPSGPPGPGEWDKWTHDVKLAYMKSAVMPKMGDLFKGFDAKRYGDMKCKTCHGAKAEDGSFVMPNPDLPKLDFKGQLKTEKAKHPKSVEFMMKKVNATMQTLLGEQPYDPKTQQGFGCANCHTAAK
jgi:hypothetical protein